MRKRRGADAHDRVLDAVGVPRAEESAAGPQLEFGRFARLDVLLTDLLNARLSAIAVLAPAMFVICSSVENWPALKYGAVRAMLRNVGALNRSLSATLPVTAYKP